MFEGCADIQAWEVANFISKEPPTNQLPSTLSNIVPCHSLTKLKTQISSTRQLFPDLVTPKQGLEELLLRKQQNSKITKHDSIKFIFDGELIENENKKWEFLMFDTIYFDGKLMVGRDYLERLEKCYMFKSKNRFYQGFFDRAKSTLQMFTGMRVRKELAERYARSGRERVSKGEQQNGAAEVSNLDVNVSRGREGSAPGNLEGDSQVLMIYSVQI